MESNNSEIIIYQTEDGYLDETSVVRKFRTTTPNGNSCNTEDKMAIKPEWRTSKLYLCSSVFICG